MAERLAGVRSVAVIGAGTIGASWAAAFAAKGLAVTASDPAPDGEAFLRRYVEGAWPALTRLGLAPGADPASICFVRDPVQAVAGAEFVQENGPEREDVKIELLNRIDAVLPPETVIATSSSGLLVSRLQPGCRHPERIVLGHPFNPPHLIPLVEVVGGKLTSASAIDRAMAFYAAVGKRPIHIRKEVPGHVANRLQAAIWRECLHLLETGVASVADIDAAIAYGPGLRWALMGPNLTFHLAGAKGGIDQFMANFSGPIATWWPTLGNPEMSETLKSAVVAGVHEEAAGRSLEALSAERDRLLVALLELTKDKKLP